MSRLDRFDRILASLHEAMLDETRWRETSTLIDEACGITGTHLVIVGGQCHTEVRWLFDRAYCHGEDRKEQGRDYAENYFPRDERVPRLIALPDQRIVPVADLYTERELKTSPTYNELLRRCGAQDGLNIRMDGPHGIQIVWALADPTDPDGWRSDRIAMIVRLLPHIRQFVRVRQALAAARALNTSLVGLLDNTLTGVIYLDWRGRITQANSVGRAVLRCGDGLIDRDGYLRARRPEDDVRLHGLLAHALPRSGAAGVGGSMRVQRAQSMRQITLHVTPVTVGDAGFGSGTVAALVLVVDPLTRPAIDPEQLASMLGLTLAESRVAFALADGATARDIAADTGRAESTIRELVKRVHVKLGISRRADLVRIVLSAGMGDQGPSP